MTSRRGTGHQKRKFIPRFPEKYLGDKRKIVSRSSWEYMVMTWLDKNPSVLRWSSEEVIVQYHSPVDGETHRYFVDFYCKFVAADGSIKEKLIEVKPHAQTIEPKNRHAKNYQMQVETYVVNRAKWEAASKYAKARNMEFQVLTEYSLGLAKREAK